MSNARREEDLEDETIPRGGSAAQNGAERRCLRVLDVVIDRIVVVFSC